jgi:DNA-binding MarR family transcriptional regulator
VFVPVDERPVGAATDEPVAAIAESLVDLVHTFSRVKARLLTESRDLEWSSHVVLRHLACAGPVRAAALAEALQLDPSTVSRQVATLVRLGMLQRQADPVDGRASLLVLTPSGRAVTADHDQRRRAYFAQLFSAWPADDIDRFAVLFPRFVADFDAAAARWLAAPGPQTAADPQKDTA